MLATPGESGPKPDPRVRGGERHRRTSNPSWRWVVSAMGALATREARGRKAAGVGRARALIGDPGELRGRASLATLFSADALEGDHNGSVASIHFLFDLGQWIEGRTIVHGASRSRHWTATARRAAMNCSCSLLCFVRETLRNTRRSHHGGLTPSCAAHCSSRHRLGLEPHIAQARNYKGRCRW